MGTRVQVELVALLNNENIEIDFNYQPQIVSDPYHAENNPRSQIAHVVFNVEGISEESVATNFFTSTFDVLVGDSGQITLETDFNCHRGHDHTLKLQRCLLECSVPHLVLP